MIIKINIFNLLLKIDSVKLNKIMKERNLNKIFLKKLIDHLKAKVEIKHKILLKK